MKYPPGEFPDDWLQWVDDNLLRGVEPGRIVSILASKGFHPHRNIRLMHRILTWNSLLQFNESHPDIDIYDTTVKLHDDFVEWIRLTASKGIDGEIIFQLLKDRFIDLEKESIYLCQKLRNNELGSLMEKNEEHAHLLDFWHACKNGYLEDVIIYCKCGVNVNEEVVDRYTCERTRALAYAASNGHAEVIKELLSHGADINHIDKRGRNAVHIAALRGHVQACVVLMDYGGKLFAGDMHGNNALHLAAVNNHYEVVDFLAAKGQDLARLITSDKVLARKNTTFIEMATQVFEQLPGIKLKSNETVRFEKHWLNDGALLLAQLMDEDVKFMLPRCCEEIMEDVLARFDPRPETGIFVTNDVTGKQVFIKAVANPNELSILLKYTYRQAAIDSINRFHRTALHMACDANKVNSHEKIIFRLIDTYGCNVNLKDMHTRRAIDLLIRDKIIRDMPSATEEREKLLMSRREADLHAIFESFDSIDRKRTEERRQNILDECIRRGNELEDRLWTSLREASIFRKRFGLEWEMYEDPDTGNHFYTRIPEKRLMGDPYSEYSWKEPKKAKHMIDYTFALDYLRRIQSTFLRKFGDWEIYRCKKTDIEFYYQIATGSLRFTPPVEMEWNLVLKESVSNEERLGYAKEWEVLKDKYGNVFYRNRLTKVCEYDRPLDAVSITPPEMLCTLYQVSQKILYVYYVYSLTSFIDVCSLVQKYSVRSKVVFM
jgi:ankyrin repeat protein